jgi:translation initiation factor 4E
VQKYVVDGGISLNFPVVDTVLWRMAAVEGTEEKHSVEAMAESIPEKHPLQNRWALWYFKSDKNKDWKDNLKLVISFDTVEEFWSVYNHIKPASQVPPGCDYMLFKDGIEPMWEDARNKSGGRWLFNLEKRDRKDLLDHCWLETLMCLIGEGFDESSDEVCGSVVQIRNKGDKIAIWTGNVEKVDDIMHIG